ncbi:nitrogenase cofactor biosynthesis protein NifB [Clostridium cellulovorans]|uniref:FeMo cofactor biosynthesis protein NifB n=1 Tax=Clostridium cellulovorans (strain ATCC 35296 / DSM 3052 / OCM 3 / 743B) TaxID=573061 RepID=D9SS79_CLOC7|nr:nitrogenase cofactor biosynthesis protein NifB [Clostridium cellulovorans]ADL52526.1 nitrogenase cofactor biosynthesis protein NifB [Clostridium cellulovorans 743B]
MKEKNYANLNVNPCKMCMPLGAMLAFKGIEGNMTILHGSQGCSTYIRRHMATHYNEPVDIASSSLTEDGTVYGGAKNLKNGIRNMINLYHPTTIGIATTCLAETIGEDVKRIVTELYEEEKETGLLDDIKIISLGTPGYGGTQAEGYYRAIRAMVETLAVKTGTSNNKINVICGNINPGDIRNIKALFEKMKIDYVLLPDISENLDGGHSSKYNRLKNGGTKVEDIVSMGDSIATIEMGVTVSEEDSTAVYLRDKFNIPIYKCPIPIGVKNTDIFLEVLSEVSGKAIPEECTKDRERLLDGMIDNHKYNGEARAVVYGEPELVFAIVNTCSENGIIPKIIATGSKNKKLVELVLEKSFKDEEIIVLDDTDFETIEALAKENHVNMMIGNSDGRRMAERLNLEIVRIGFPVHDRVGAQREIFTLYNGTGSFIDKTANVILKYKEEHFREEAYNKYYDDRKDENVGREITMITNKEKTLTHPCYNQGAHEFSRMHIPVAPKCNIQCNYCVRKYDCTNESRPGVTSDVLSPEGALEKVKAVKAKIDNLKVLGIAGPGDALANFEETKQSIKLIKNEYPDMTMCLSTNGLMLPFYANDIVELGVSHVTVTINAVEKEIAAKIYKHIDYLGTRYEGEAAAEIMINNQLSGLKYLASKGVVCKVNIVMIKGINDHHIEKVVAKAKECGAFISNIMQHIPVKGSGFEDRPLVSNIELNDMRKKCEGLMKQMYHCKQCRADAIGTLNQDRSIEFRNFSCSGSCSNKKAKENKKSYRFAIATKSGINIDEHFGQAEEFHIYSYCDGDIKFDEKRVVAKYCNGIEDCEDHDDKIAKIIKVVSDCVGVLAIRAGESPVKRLAEKGITIFQMYDGIYNGINKAMETVKENEKQVVNK